MSRLHHNTNRVHAESFTATERFALLLTQRVGTFSTFVIIAAWTVLWLLWNMLAPGQLRFDPFPGFVLWLFISNMIQLALLPLLMVGQTLQSRHAEIAADHHYAAGQELEKELVEIQRKLDTLLDGPVLRLSSTSVEQHIRIVPQ